MLCCETRSYYARRHNDVEGHSNFSSTVYSFSILCLEHHYCGDQLRAFTYLKVKFVKCLSITSGGLGLGLCYFGLGLKNLVLVC